MDKFILAEMIKKSRPINRNIFIKERCCGKDVLDLGCIQHNSDCAVNDPNWLHGIIKSVAQRVLGVDYLIGEVEKLKYKGYDIVFGDVTKPLLINDKFDVIVAGDLIEHLSNFEGFFTNCKRLLKDKGILIITTPNPYHSACFHYILFKNNFMINPEHTCLIDPLCLSELCGRFGFKISEMYYINNKWDLAKLICETKKYRYDNMIGKWQNDSYGFRLIRKIVRILFPVFYVPYKIISLANSKLCKYDEYLSVLTIE